MATPSKPDAAGSGSNTIGSPDRETTDRRRAPDAPPDAGEQYGKRTSEERNDPAVQPGAADGKRGHEDDATKD